MTPKSAKKTRKSAKTTKSAKAAPGVTKPGRVSLKKAVSALQKLLRELDALPAGRAAAEERSVEGLRKQIEGMVLTMEGACQSGAGTDDFSFPSA